jgi:hypothetical protein
VDARASFQLQKIEDGHSGKELTFGILWMFMRSHRFKNLTTAISTEDTMQNAVIFWNTESGEEISRIILQDQPAQAITFQPDHQRVLIADDSNLYTVNLTISKSAARNRSRYPMIRIQTRQNASNRFHSLQMASIWEY